MVFVRSGRLRLPAFIQLNPTKTRMALSKATSVLAVLSMLPPNFAALAGSPAEQASQRHPAPAVPETPNSSAIERHPRASSGDRAVSADGSTAALRDGRAVEHGKPDSRFGRPRESSPASAPRPIQLTA